MSLTRKEYRLNGLCFLNINNMKAKLLKKLRAKFVVEYFPSTKLYKASGNIDSYHDQKHHAIAQRDCDMINYGRKYYHKYSKRILI